MWGPHGESTAIDLYEDNLYEMNFTKVNGANDANLVQS